MELQSHPSRIGENSRSWCLEVVSNCFIACHTIGSHPRCHSCHRDPILSSRVRIRLCLSRSHCFYIDTLSPYEYYDNVLRLLAPDPGPFDSRIHRLRRARFDGTNVEETTPSGCFLSKPQLHQQTVETVQPERGETGERHDTGKYRASTALLHEDGVTR